MTERDRGDITQKIEVLGSPGSAAPGLRPEIFGLTDVGHVRTHNEDSFLVDDQHVTVTKAGLLVLDRLLWDFFKPEHRGSRYS